MPNYHGQHHYLLYGRETTYGTAVATSLDVGLVQSFTLNGNMNWKREWSLGNIDLQAMVSGKLDLTGSMEFLFQHGRIIEEITGGTTTHAETTGDWRHTFVFADDVASMSIREGVDASSDIEFLLKGVVLNSLTLSLALDGVLRGRADFNVRDVDPSGTTASAQTISTLTVLPDFFGTVSFGVAGSEVAKASVKSLEFTIRNDGAGEMRDWGLDAKKAAASIPNQRQIEFRFSLTFQDVTEWNRFLGATTGVLDDGTEIANSGLIIDINNGVVLGSGRRDIYIDLSNVVINTVTKPVNIGGYIVQDFAGYARTVDSLRTTDNIADTSW